MYQRGKPFVGAMVWFHNADRYYTVVEVYPDAYKWRSSLTNSTYISSNSTFLEEGERPYYTATDYIKALKKCLQSLF